MTKEPRVGADSFWEMVALAMSGRLASCTSCVEHFYFQSEINSSLFLEACASAGLLQKVSLLDLFGEVGSHVDPSLRRYDEPIYLSAPEFRRALPDEARQRMDNTKRAVYSALRLFFEELRADENAVAAAYDKAVATRILRHADLAERRKEVEMSSLAKLRLIQDGFRFAVRKRHKAEAKAIDRRAEEREVASCTTKYVRPFLGVGRGHLHADQLDEDIETFVLDFLTNANKLEEFWDSKVGILPRDYWIRWFPVMLTLASDRYRRMLEKVGQTEALQFADRFSEAVTTALRQEANDSVRAHALDSLLDDWTIFASSHTPAEAFSRRAESLDSPPSSYGN